jgi:MFS family permease
VTTAPDGGVGEEPRPGAVLANRPFLLLWLAQAATQIGGNMVLYGLTVIVFGSTGSKSAVSALILTFLVPAVLFSAVAGVYVDRIDRRLILVVTNVIRAAAILLIFFVGDHLLAILLLNIFVSTVTVFFAPAEAAMIPFLVPRRQLLSANGIFTLTLNGAFALGFALMGPLVVTLFGPGKLILLVAVLYLVAAGFCWTLPAAPPTPDPETSPVRPRQAVADAEKAVESTLAELREGLSYIRAHRNITWSLVYLGITASLVGVLGVLGPAFATQTLGLAPKDFVVVVLPLAAGIVMGILLLNSYGKYLPRRRVIEVGLIALGAMLALLSISGPISRFLQQADRSSSLLDLSSLTSLLAVVVVIAFAAGIAYAAVAIPSQTQLQEDLPEDVRGRVFGVLNMLVSVSSFVPIIVVGPISDLPFVGTTGVILVVAILIAVSGILSIVRRGPLLPTEAMTTAAGMVSGMVVDPVAVTHAEPARAYERAHRPATGDGPAGARTTATARANVGPSIRDAGAAPRGPDPAGDPASATTPVPTAPPAPRVHPPGVPRRRKDDPPE